MSGRDMDLAMAEEGRSARSGPATATDLALLQQPAPEGRDPCPSLLTIIGFAFLTFNSVMAIYRSNGDPTAVAFVVFSYLDLVLLFYFLRLGERQGDPRRKHIKMAVWLLTTMLTAAFSYKVATIIPQPMGLLFCLMMFIAGFGYYCGFFAPRIN